VSHLGILPRASPSDGAGSRRLVRGHDAEGFGSCANAGECEAACPKQISLFFISQLNRDLLRSGGAIGRESSRLAEAM